MYVTSQQGHDVVVKLLRRRFGPDGPGVQVPLVVSAVDQRVVLLELSAVERLQMLVGERGEDNAVLQNSPLPGLVHQTAPRQIYFGSRVRRLGAGHLDVTSAANAQQTRIPLRPLQRTKIDFNVILEPEVY